MTTLPEELILLALNEEKGTVGASAITKETITFAVCAAMILELITAGRVELRLPEKKFFMLKIDRGSLKVIDPAPTGDDILDDALKYIRVSGKNKGPYYWIDKLGRFTVSKDAGIIDYSGKCSRYLARLAGQGMIHKTEHRSLGVISSPRYKLMDPTVRLQLQQRITHALFEPLQPRQRTAMLICMARISRLLEEMFPQKQQLHEARENATRIQHGDPVVDFLAGEVIKVRSAHDTVVIS